MTFDRPRFLVDVDGPCAGMIPAFLGWINAVHRLDVREEDIVFHNCMGRSPALREIDQRLRRDYYPGEGDEGGWGGAFVTFMRSRDVYSRFVKPVEGSQEAVRHISERCDVAFVTALMKRANAHVPDKLDWIGRTYPGIPIFTVPSEYKCWVPGTFAVDDRYDTCQRWIRAGTGAFLFKKPWSECPNQSVPGYDWAGIVRATDTILDLQWI